MSRNPQSPSSRSASIAELVQTLRGVGIYLVFLVHLHLFDPTELDSNYYRLIYKWALFWNCKIWTFFSLGLWSVDCLGSVGGAKRSDCPSRLTGGDWSVPKQAACYWPLWSSDTGAAEIWVGWWDLQRTMHTHAHTQQLCGLDSPLCCFLCVYLCLSL